MRSLWVCLLLCGSLYAEYKQPIFDFNIGVGYRHDNYETLISGFKRNHTTHFTRPTLEKWKWNWSEIQIVESSAYLRYTTCLNYYFRFNGDWGRIHAGEAHVEGWALLPSSSEQRHHHHHHKKRHRHNNNIIDSGFQEFSRIEADANRGCVMDFSGCVGYQFTSNGQRVIVTPLVGWSYQQARLQMHHGKQTLDRFAHHFPILGKIPDLHVTFTPRRYGPFIGADVEVQVDVPCVLLFGTIEYHWDQFKSIGNWNFSNVFINRFKEHSNGHGLIVQGGVSHKLQHCLWVSVYGTYRNFQAGKGYHRTTHHKNDLLFHHQNFGTFPVFDRHLDNDVKYSNWDSWVATVAFEYRF